MHLNRNILIAVLGLTTGMASTLCAQEKAEEDADVLNAVVKLEVGVSRRHYARRRARLRCGADARGHTAHS